MQVQAQEIQIENPNVIETDYHTLFIDDIRPKLDPVPLSEEEQQEMDCVQLHREIPGKKVYTLMIGDFSAENYKENYKIIKALQDADPDDEIHIKISSHGGNFDEFIQFYNAIKPKFNLIHTYIENIAYSAGAMMFLMGDFRIVHEHSAFMAHTYSYGVVGKRQDLLDNISHTDKTLLKFTNKLYKPYFTKKEIQAMNKGKDFWLSTSEMKKRGICTHIIKDNGDIVEVKDKKDKK